MADPEIVFADVVDDRETSPSTQGLEPATLAEALPNRRFVINEAGRCHEFEFSDALVIGEVMKVVEGPTFVHLADDELQRVDFDDPSAVERAIDVHVQVDEAFTRRGLLTIAVGSEVMFRWGGLGGMSSDERAEYMASMKAMGRIVAVLNTREVVMDGFSSQFFRARCWGRSTLRASFTFWVSRMQSRISGSSQFRV